MDHLEFHFVESFISALLYNDTEHLTQEEAFKVIDG